MNLDIIPVGELTQFLVDLIEEEGQVVHEVESDRVLQFRERLFGVYDGGVSLAGPYADLDTLLETEAVRLVPRRADVPGHPSAGSRCLYRWRGRLCVFVVGLGFTGDEPGALSAELEGLKAT